MAQCNTKLKVGRNYHFYASAGNARELPAVVILLNLQFPMK
ncbi:MAG: hypothetical protein ACR65Q_00830 [Methylobacter sp.]